MVTHVQIPASRTIVSILPLKDPLNVCDSVELPEQPAGKGPVVTSRTMQAKRPKPELLPTPLSETFTAYQKRAALAGQQSYLEHLYGTYTSHQDLCAFLKRKLRRWDSHHTTTEWRIYWVGGWHAALLSDPTAVLGAPGKKEAGRQLPVSPTQQEHTPPLVPLALHETISALARQPDFLTELRDAQEVYWDNEYEGRLIAAEMMDLVEGHLTRRARERDGTLCRFEGVPPLSYLRALGRVVGVIGTGFVRQPW